MFLTNISLLDKDEYMKYVTIIPEIEYDWWLKTPEDHRHHINYVYTVDFAGFFDSCICWLGNRGVRPVCTLKTEAVDPVFWCKPEKLIGVKIDFGVYKWTVIDVINGQLYALCDNIIENRRFDAHRNIWAESELKSWLETEGLKLITKDE